MGSKVNTEQIHLILENYKDMSIKGAARATRATKDGNLNVGAVCEVVSEEQSLPSPLDDFFDRQSNKISYQHFFVKYCSSHYKSAKPLYLAEGLKSDPDKCTVISDGLINEAIEFRASHEEADDRIMFSVAKITALSTESCSVSVVSPDTDIFVNLLYYLQSAWHGLNLYLLRKGDFKVKTIRQKELLSLHLLLGKVESSLVRSLPAGHALTGCDTVSKVGTQLTLLKALKQYSHFITDFGLDVPDEDMFEKAEQFLVKVVASKAFMNCATFDEFRLRMRQQIRNVSFVDLPCSSNEIRLHVQRAYFQARLWLEAGTGDASQILDVTEYG